jgi:hypothetical protein
MLSLLSVADMLENDLALDGKKKIPTPFPF